MAVTNGTLPPKTYRVAQLIKLNGNALTDESRGEVSVDVERIEETKRMANGIMRKFYVADKHTFTVGWDNIPRETSKTVDGGWGGEAIETFFKANPGAVTMVVTWGDSTTQTYSVFLKDFSKDYVTRYAGGDRWNVSLSMEEI